MGEAFDPERHEAVMHIDSEELGETGVQPGVLVDGFLLLGGALTIVVVLRRQAKVFVILGRQLSGLIRLLTDQKAELPVLDENTPMQILIGPERFP